MNVFNNFRWLNKSSLVVSLVFLGSISAVAGNPSFTPKGLMDDDCAVSFQGLALGNSKNSLQKYFKNALTEGSFEEVSAILMKEREEALERMREISEEEAKKYDDHWAAQYWGKIISTPPEQLKAISEYVDFQPGQSLVDIGSGHGDPAIVFGSLNPEMKITGYELVQAKVDGANQAAKNLGVDQAKFIQQDLSDADFRLPDADYYYMFNPVYPAIVHALAEQIIEISSRRRVQVIVYGRSGWDYEILEGMGFRETTNGELYEKADARLFEYVP